MPQIGCLIILRVQSSIISINSNITDSIIRNVIDIGKSVGLRMEPWGTPTLIPYSCGYFPSRTIAATWCSGYHYCTTSFNWAWTQVLCRLKSSSQHVRDSRWWGSLKMVPAGNKAKCPLPVNHITKKFNHHHLFYT